MTDSLDLDAIVPPTKQVTLKGKTYDVLPAKLKDFVSIQKLFLSLQEVTDPDQQVKAIESITQALKPVIPAIEEMELSIDQLFALLKFAYSTSVKEADPSDTEKKTENSPTA